MRRQRLSFGSFELDPEAGTLLRDGIPVAMGYRGLMLLAALAKRTGEIQVDRPLQQHLRLACRMRRHSLCRWKGKTAIDGFAGSGDAPSAALASRSTTQRLRVSARYQSKISSPVIRATSEWPST